MEIPYLSAIKETLYGTPSSLFSLYHWCWSLLGYKSPILYGSVSSNSSSSSSNDATTSGAELEEALFLLVSCAFYQEGRVSVSFLALHLEPRVAVQFSPRRLHPINKAILPSLCGLVFSFDCTTFRFSSKLG